ncbi:5-oxoprolinase (ATP-hydrolysing) [Rhizoctonia solani]|uniref:5-oxoprolinase (ATP-hydrolysing) n=1 Tax=Rhizoctonia solani TaxID=456999 RepID=A0A8H8NZG0_9AGAM|nr:5-oxoprolinase (ATP-hydrolyzing) [Rhizoctonia solani]QRW22774.1 5-oxoprolinase (ATP-hydrolysing) [Rhizoctonia solani]
MPDTSKGPDPITLTLFANRFMGVAEAMGRMLQQTAISTNIKERLDFSCALFAPDGDLVANAPFIPIHLGAMSFAVKYQMKVHGKNLKPGDVLMSNSPSAGGSHLPDITIISPVFDESSGEVIFFTASRGHHADVGGILPGSMPPTSVSIFDEGAEITSFKIVNDGVYDQDGLRELLLIKEYGLKTVHEYMLHIRNNAEQSVRNLLRSFAKKHGNKLEARDYLDDGSPMNLRIEIDEESGSALFDFEGTGPEIRGNLNAPISVVHSAVIYCMRSMLDVDIPLNAGCLVPIKIKIPDLSFLHPSRTAAVCAGNVLTSQRIVDVVLKAFSACAASQGCTKLVPLKSNLTFGVGGKDKEGKVQQGWGYYETIAGGSGAGPGWHGTSGIHTHITNTRIGDVEILERRYPVLLHEFSLRKGSGGIGEFIGGDGVIRDIEFLHEMQVSILSERRVLHPYGMAGGGPGACGQNIWIKQPREEYDLPTLEAGEEEKPGPRMINIGGKATVFMGKGDHLVIHTPGGGGWGEPKEGGSELKEQWLAPGEKVEWAARGSLADRAAQQLEF